MRPWWILALAVPFAAPAAASDVQYPLAFIPQTQGTVSDQLSYEIRERIAASSQFRVVDPADNGFRVYFRAIDIPDQSIVAYSLTFTFDYTDAAGGAPVSDLYLDSTVGYCGAAIVASCAATAMARTSLVAHEWVDLVRQSARSAPQR